MRWESVGLRNTAMPSSAIRTFHYDAAHRALTIQFQTGHWYTYEDVPLDIFEGMWSAPSKGEFFNAKVRDRFYYRRDQLAS
jgi:hypothetical protein